MAADDGGCCSFTTKTSLDNSSSSLLCLTIDRRAVQPVLRDFPPLVRQKQNTRSISLLRLVNQNTRLSIRVLATIRSERPGVAEAGNRESLAGSHGWRLAFVILLLWNVSSIRWQTPMCRYVITTIRSGYSLPPLSSSSQPLECYRYETQESKP